MMLHPLHTDIAPPSQFNNPFNYEPHPLCLLAAKEVQDYIARQEAWREEVSQGKMFGVLVVELPPTADVQTANTDAQTANTDAQTTATDTPPQLAYLAAYSGQLLGRSDWDGFVPAVFDYLQPDGYFKQEEAAISDINQQIARLSTSPERLRLKKQITALLHEAETAVNRQHSIMTASKMLRDQRRQSAFISEGEREEMVRESQFQKAQLKRIRHQYADEIGKKEGKMQILNDEIRALEQERKNRSRALQHWLFSHFEMCSATGSKRSLADIFSETAFGEPPSGAGECCEPKLLQYAYTHRLRPRCMAMFWYGGHPKAEIRHHGQFYPACSGKCKPILQWMLPADIVAGWKVTSDDDDPHPLTLPDILYEDETLLVINKPADLLTIPGIETRHSVYTIFRKRYPDTDSPLIVHRLDMPTSGLLVLAKTREAYSALQQQFAERTVSKRYAAILDGIPTHAATAGTIALPLRPDLFDRPRQVVDHDHGKVAVTEYRIKKTEEGKTWMELCPKTGRTHQLRVHCAHPDGLGCPIMGDNLYGKKAARLYLHAEYLEFTHPATGKRMSFSLPAPF